MLKAALVLLVVAIGVGALMPAGPSPDSAVATNEAQPLLIDSVRAAPPPSQTVSGQTVSLDRQRDGHFYADAQVNGGDVHFMVDTGATVVSLTRADAERVGLTVDPSEFEVVAQGASGPVMGKLVVLRDVTLGDHRVSDVPALVLADAGQSLLGQNVLAKFATVSIENDQMLLR